MVRSTSSAEFNGLVDGMKQMLFFQCTLRRIYLGIAQLPERMIDLLETGQLYPPLDLCVDARAVYDDIGPSDACAPAECSLKRRLVSVRNRLSHDLGRQFDWVDTMDMLADGLSKGGIDSFLPHAASNDCKYDANHLSLVRSNVGSATKVPEEVPDVGFEHRDVAARGEYLEDG